MKKEYETPRAEKVVFDYTDVIVTSGELNTLKNKNKGCDISEDGQSFHNFNQCPG